MNTACTFGFAPRSHPLFLGMGSARSLSLKSNGRNGSSFVASAKKRKENMEGMENVVKWTGEIQKQMTEFRSPLIETQGSEQRKNEKNRERNESISVLQSLDSVLHKLMDRQERFFKEERDYWLAERAEWKKCESELRKEIALLHERLLNQIPAESSSNSSPSKEKSETTDAAVMQPAEENHLDVNVTVEQSINTAISAVEHGDVLSKDYEKLLRLSNNGVKAPAEDSQLTNVKEDVPLETVKSPPTGPPPTLAVGDDDIYWVSQLQAALGQKGYYCGDDDAEDFYFGEGTVSALLTFQACTGLKETGTTNSETWQALLGTDLKPVVGNVDSDSAATVTEQNDAGREKNEETIEFPVLSEFDGGKDVHCLQVMLELAGYSCGKDDMMWWHYGDDTIAAVKTFQACHGLPQSGVADVVTWEKLVGEGKLMKDIRRIVKKEQIYEEDLTKSDRVWLIGEQRWERKL